jgi:hypothetical protein
MPKYSWKTTRVVNTLKKVSTNALYCEDYTKLNFGKYRGIKLENIPTAYLRWVLKNADNIDLNWRDVIEMEVKKRID